LAGSDRTRRGALALGAAGAYCLVVRPARADAAKRDVAIQAFTGGATVRTGRIKLDLPPLVENGNAAPVTISVESPMTVADHVRRIALVNERNPEAEVLTAHFGPRSGRAFLATRIRLADTQRITALAEMSDGTYWQDGADVIVTLAACVEG
jgi:sulfur-oxidizing protein SoxY